MITYDYDAIEDALGEMIRRAEAIADLTDSQQVKVRETLVGWHGATSDQYHALSDDLERDLRANVQFIKDLQARLRTGSDDMRMQDATSAAKLGQG
jgi:uncharacterized protein YukE